MLSTKWIFSSCLAELFHPQWAVIIPPEKARVYVSSKLIECSQWWLRASPGCRPPPRDLRVGEKREGYLRNRRCPSRRRFVVVGGQGFRACLAVPARYADRRDRLNDKTATVGEAAGSGKSSQHYGKRSILLVSSEVRSLN